MRYYLSISAVVVLALLLTGCGGPKEDLPPIKIALGPTFYSSTVSEDFAPLAAKLGEELGRPVEFIPTKSIDEFSDVIKGGEAYYCFADPISFAEISDYSYVLAKPSYVDGGTMRMGSVITNEAKAKEITDVSTMKGASIMIVDKMSGDGYLSQKMWFGDFGLDLDNDFELSQGQPEDIIEAVKNEAVVYGCVPASMAPSEPGKGFVIIKTTPKVPVEVIAFYEEGDKDEATKLKEAFKSIPDNDPSLEALGIKSFTVATQAEYDQVLMFLAQDKLNKAQREPTPIIEEGETE
ncbi:MAG: phosphate/phosphite/phosphonate ABC transporter substrate-binding protein [bacterium]|nr:phosphate/phosphite/phosphonate ABC transporter substrate-binding protein [bacterium]